MMYKIDWNKYLSAKRYRQSTGTHNANADDYTDKRNPFESDFGRVIFSSAMRRMHDKAQVVPLTSGDSIHTRLTHSMEVLSIAYSLGIDICRDKEFRELYSPEELLELERRIPVILKTAAFVHDIGNPPFGHFGETIIQNYFKDYLQKRHITDQQALDFTCFDGNAEGFRILTRLQFIGDLAGLNLTYGTLAAYLKYPNDQDINKNYIGTKKHGVFTSESDVLNDVIDSCGMRMENGKVKRHPLSFLVEAADSISYNIMDVEDGFTMGWYSFDDVIDFINKFMQKESGDEKYSILDKLHLAKSFKEKCINENDGRRKMCDFRVAITRYFVELAIKNFKANLERIDKGTYSKELIEDGDSLSKAFHKFAVMHIYPQREIEQIELTGYSVLNGLLDILTQCAFNSDKKFRNHLKSIFSRTFIKVAMREKENKEDIAPQEYKFYSDIDLFNLDVETLDTYARLRMIVDFLSGMTDKYAVSLYQQLSGQKLI